MFTRIGVIGYGAFGRLLVDELTKVVERVFVYDLAKDASLPDNAEFTNLAQLANCEVIFLATTFDAFDDVLAELATFLGQDTIVADVCSVKLKPLAKMQKLLPTNTKIVATHPLFGPESGRQDQIKKAVICTESDEEAMGKIASLYQQLDWEVINMTADEHDLEMARIHGLTFFIAETLLELNLPEPTMPTSFYVNLQNLVEIQAKHSDKLTETIEKHNPYSADARARFLQVAKDLNRKFNN